MRWTSLLVAILLPFVACEREDGGASAIPGRATEDPERIERAADALQAARVAEPDRKVDALSDVAQLYWDTDAGAVAALEAIHERLRTRPTELTATMRDLTAFARGRPGDPRLIAAAELVALAADDRFRSGKAPQSELAQLESVRDQAVSIWAREAEAFALGDGSDRADVHYSLGRARLVAEDWEGTEKAWARIEELEESAGLEMRINVLIERAELAEKRRGDPAAAAALRAKARELVALVEDEKARAPYLEVLDAAEGAGEDRAE